jgi:hypothetical protein
MGRVFAGAGAALGFIALVVLLALACAEWRLATFGPRNAYALADQLGDSSFAPPRSYNPPARSYTLASLDTSGLVVIDGASDSDIETTGSLGAGTERATFDERFKAGFLYYELEEEADPGSEPRVAAVPPIRELQVERGSSSLEMPRPEARTAIYDISAHVVYLPNGQRLEAHSGLGRNMDNPRSAAQKNRGATPPNVYDLVMRESRFHGVRAIRLLPVDESKMHGRDGILAHSYMLRSRGQSNGCVVFRDYPQFLNAFLKGEVDRLVVVDHLDAPPKTKVAAAAQSASNQFKQRVRRGSRSASRGDSPYGI